MYRISKLAIAAGLAGFFLHQSAIAQNNPSQFLNRASAKVAQASSLKNRWEGPTEGPKLLKKKKIVVIAADLSDAATKTVFSTMREASSVANWEFLSIDCRGSCQSGATVQQALDMRPDGIVFAGVDAASQSKGIAAANKAKIPIVGWHASTKSGPVDGLFTNVTSNPKEVAQTAALFTIVDSSSRAGIVIFTDSSNPFILAKSNVVVEVIKQCEGCKLLSIEDISLNDTGSKMKTAVESLVKRHGSKWTHIIAANDFYFDLLEANSIAPLIANLKLTGISAGDGTNTAYKRIKNKVLQAGAVAEPLQLQGWQIVDEMNRALSNAEPSGYSTAVHLVTDHNIAFEGGNKNVFDPSNDYRTQYQKYWTK